MCFGVLVGFALGVELEVEKLRVEHLQHLTSKMPLGFKTGIAQPSTTQLLNL